MELSFGCLLNMSWSKTKFISRNWEVALYYKAPYCLKKKKAKNNGGIEVREEKRSVNWKWTGDERKKCDLVC